MKTAPRPRFQSARMLGTLCGALALAGRGLLAEPITILHTFGLSPKDGIDPHYNGLVLSGDTLFGATEVGASTTNIYSGCVFAMNTDGTEYTVLHVFDSSTEGRSPSARLVLSGDTLYGTAQLGGTYGYGSLFSMKTNGEGFTVLHAFAGSDGSGANSLQLSGTTLYGTTDQGGANSSGTIYSVGIDGSGFTVLHDFSAGTGSPVKTNVDGIGPAALALSDNTLYGTAGLGGANGGGTLFSVNNDGSGFNVLHNFGTPASTNDGNQLLGELAINGGQIYGTTIHAGAYRRGVVFSVSTNGSGFALVHSFNHTDGDQPYGGVLLSGNTLYGTTIAGGTGGHGVVFAVNTDGSGYNVLYNFSVYTAGNNTNTDGAMPEAGLVLSGLTLYGVTAAGGAAAAGTAFSLQLLPSISNMAINGADLVLNVANAVAGSQYVVLKSNDPSKPLNQWTSIVTNAPAGTGTIVITAPEAVNPQEPQAFYLLKVQ